VADATSLRLTCGCVRGMRDVRSERHAISAPWRISLHPFFVLHRGANVMLVKGWASEMLVSDFGSREVKAMRVVERLSEGTGAGAKRVGIGRAAILRWANPTCSRDPSGSGTRRLPGLLDIQHVGETLRSDIVHSRHHVAVGRQREGDVGVAHPLRDELGVLAGRQA